jgi:hypothetical protein
MHRDGGGVDRVEFAGCAASLDLKLKADPAVPAAFRYFGTTRAANDVQPSQTLKRGQTAVSWLLTRPGTR